MKTPGFPGSSESQVEPHPEHRGRVWPRRRRLENLYVESQMRRRCNRNIVEGFEALAPVVDANDVDDPAFLDMAIEISEAEGVVVTTGDDPTPAEAETDGKVGGVGLIVGDPDTSENSNSLMIRFAAAPIDQTLGFALCKEELP